MTTYNYANISISGDYSSLIDDYTISGPTIDLSNLNTQTVSIGTGSSSSYGLYTTAGSNGTIGPIYTSTSASSAKVILTDKGMTMGEECDVKIGDWSLKEFARKMEERLAILSPNPQLESEWEELKSLGEQYRKLEQEIKEKMKTWDILKKE